MLFVLFSCSRRFMKVLWAVKWCCLWTLRKSQIDAVQFEKILRYIRSGIESKATLECGGGRLGSKGFYIQPTVFSNVQVRISMLLLRRCSTNLASWLFTAFKVDVCKENEWTASKAVKSQVSGTRLEFFLVNDLKYQLLSSNSAKHLLN